MYLDGNKKKTRKNKCHYVTIPKDFWQSLAFILCARYSFKMSTMHFWYFPQHTIETKKRELSKNRLIFRLLKFYVWMTCWDFSLGMWFTVILSHVNESLFLLVFPLCRATYICPCFYQMKLCLFFKYELKFCTIGLTVLFSVELKLIIT